MVGHNFGAGSSREHAAWALVDYGFRALIGLSFADIFAGNAVQNGLLTITVPPAVHETLVALAPAPATIDLPAQRLTLGGLGADHDFEIEPFAKMCLREGIGATRWLSRHVGAIETYESKTGN